MSEEEELIRRLKRTPKQSLVNELESMARDEWMLLTINPEARDEFLAKHGWGYDEWLSANRMYRMEDGTIVKMD